MNYPSVKGQSVLITGGAGFIGSHLAEALLPENEVIILDDLSSGRREHVPAEAEFINGTILNRSTVQQAMDGVDIVFHEAAIVSVDESIQDPLATHAVNVDGTLSVLDAARDRDAKVVLASSAAIYGPPEAVPLQETYKMRPSSPYGLDKLAVDRYAFLYHELYGMDTVALRYFNVYGPRQSAADYSGVISVFLDQASRGVPLTVHGDGEQTRDFIHVDDVVEANLLAAASDVAGVAFNVGTGEQTSIQDLAAIIDDATDGNSEIEHTKPQAGDIRHSCADVQKISNDLGFEPSVTIERGIEQLVH